MRRIGIAVFDNLTILDGVGPYEAFSALPSTTVDLIATSTAPLRTEHGMSLIPTAATDDIRPLDVLCRAGRSRRHCRHLGSGEE